ncbi:phosphatidate cytidylyltransferase [Enterovirga rhinocerotis]|uniref:Phosphatidate cytidylyltransferase n=1 Tax=Enterovirga rhinocerotis TaxID=1339210 RepID=A0A4R7C7F7_9HYPH|nr:phosphatidate cytidylyltransferase [Enterovirga rhinocerotis]TDR94328.1 phosphatidate cytidylyltransferase [Enterovirga rhinocerotis]
MIHDRSFLLLVGGILAFLAVASLIGWVLARRAADAASRATVENLNARIRAWWVMVAVLAGALALGWTATILLFGLLSFFALREFLSLTPTKPADHWPLLAAFYVFLPAQYVLIGWDWYGLFSVLIPVYAYLLLPILGVVRGDTEDYVLRMARIQWGVMLAVYCISHAPALLLLPIPGYEGRTPLLLVYLIVVVQLSDVMQYVFGKLFGRTKVAPRVSPSKTVEGLAGGVAAAVAIGTALYGLTPFTPLQAMGLSAVIAIMGFFGGLVLSAAKRSMGVKDWGTAIEGHGGVLDRLDSVCFAAPVFFHLTRYWFTP